LIICGDAPHYVCYLLWSPAASSCYGPNILSTLNKLQYTNTFFIVHKHNKLVQKYLSFYTNIQLHTIILYK
jgi:hypothetical protein